MVIFEILQLSGNLISKCFLGHRQNILNGLANFQQSANTGAATEPPVYDLILIIY